MGLRMFFVLRLRLSFPSSSTVIQKKNMVSFVWHTDTGKLFLPGTSQHDELRFAMMLQMAWGFPVRNLTYIHRSVSTEAMRRWRPL